MIDQEEGDTNPKPPHALPGEKIRPVVTQVTRPAQPVQPPIKVNVSEKLPLAEGFQPDVFRADAFQAAPSSTTDARALAALRPVEVMLRGPLGEVARKERRSLLGISAIAILVGWTGLVPAKIENFGITFAAPERKALLWVFVAVVLYYSVAFIVYALHDFLSYLYAVHQGSAALRRQRDEERDAATISIIAPNTAKPSGDTPWSFVRYVTPASLVRGVFDFAIPLAVAGVAIWSLWGAVHQVTTSAPGTPATPAVAPAPSR